MGSGKHQRRGRVERGAGARRRRVRAQLHLDWCSPTRWADYAMGDCIDTLSQEKEGMISKTDQLDNFGGDVGEEPINESDPCRVHDWTVDSCAGNF